MDTMASQITSLRIVYSAVYSGTYQGKYQSSASGASVRGTHRGPVNSPHKVPVTRKILPFDDVIMLKMWNPVLVYSMISHVFRWKPIWHPAPLSMCPSTSDMAVSGRYAKFPKTIYLIVYYVSCTFSRKLYPSGCEWFQVNIDSGIGLAPFDNLCFWTNRWELYTFGQIWQNSTYFRNKSFDGKWVDNNVIFISFGIALAENWYSAIRLVQYIPRNMHTVFALLCFVVVIHWLILPYPSGLLNWHCGNLKIAPVPAKQPWRIWMNTSCEFIMNDCITTTKQSTTKPCAYFLGFTVYRILFPNHRPQSCTAAAFYVTETQLSFLDDNLTINIGHSLDFMAH